MDTNLSVHAASPVEGSGQLPFLGLLMQVLILVRPGLARRGCQTIAPLLQGADQ